MSATVLLMALTATVSTATVMQSHTRTVAFRDAGWRIDRPVPAPTQLSAVRSPSSTPAPTPKPSAAPVHTPQPAPAPSTGAAPAPPPGPPAREVLGFAPYWTLDTWPQWRMQSLSTIAYFAVTIDGNGNVVPEEGWAAWQGQALVDMVNAAHAQHVRVLVTVKCFDEDGIYNIVTNGQAEAVAVRTATDLMRMRGMDGVVLDFEGVADGAHPGIQQGVTRFSARLRDAVHAVRGDAEYVLAAYSSSAASDDTLLQIGALSPTVDAFFVMGYDMPSANTPGRASPNAPITGFQYNDSNAVQQYLARTSPDKVILGVPYYGYKWTVSSPDPNAPVTSDPTLSTYSQMLADFSCARQLAVHGNDPTPWATWYSPADGDPCGANAGGWREMYFDTAASLGAKYDLVNGANLRGTGMWALGFDAGRGELWDALASHVTARR